MTAGIEKVLAVVIILQAAACACHVGRHAQYEKWMPKYQKHLYTIEEPATVYSMAISSGRAFLLDTASGLYEYYVEDGSVSRLFGLGQGPGELLNPEEILVGQGQCWISSWSNDGAVWHFSLNEPAPELKKQPLPF